MRVLRLCLLFFLAPAFSAPAGAGPAGVKVWITLRDKGPTLAKTVLSERVFEDAPVYAPYLETLRGAGFAVSVTLKWQNRVSGWAAPAALEALEALPFVTGVEELPRKAPAIALPKASTPSAQAGALAKSALDRFSEYGRVFDSTGASVLADTVLARGLRPGEGVRIAVIDEDFHLGNNAFDSLFARGAIADQWNFPDSAPQAVFRTLEPESHGAWVLSLLAADLPGTAVGLAPRAKYLLYRTEIQASESYVEEDYLAAALERAVDSGAQVINISLGYRYDIDGGLETAYSEMDGHTRPSSIAALGAARRGALVVVAIGNEYDRGTTPTLVAPADADSILTVGMEDAARARCPYSSTGPTSDGRRKPEVSSMGFGAACAVPLVNPGADSGMDAARSGTSFAAPVVSAIAALLRQLHPDGSGVTAQDIRAALMATAARAASPDNLVGNGLVRAAEAHCLLEAGSACRAPVPPVAIKGLFVWRGGYTATMPWPGALDLGGARMWDLRGRAGFVQGGRTEEGDLLLRSNRRLAPGSYILKIPVPSATTP